MCPPLFHQIILVFPSGGGTVTTTPYFFIKRNPPPDYHPATRMLRATGRIPSLESSPAPVTPLNFGSSEIRPNRENPVMARRNSQTVVTEAETNAISQRNGNFLEASSNDSLSSRASKMDKRMPDTQGAEANIPRTAGETMSFHVHFDKLSKPDRSPAHKFIHRTPSPYPQTFEHPGAHRSGIKTPSTSSRSSNPHVDFKISRPVHSHSHQFRKRPLSPHPSKIPDRDRSL